jgi:hypothetical protein
MDLPKMLYWRLSETDNSTGYFREDLNMYYVVESTKVAVMSVCESDDMRLLG